MASVDERRRGLVLSLVTFNEHVRARQSCVRDAAPWLAEWPA